MSWHYLFGTTPITPQPGLARLRHHVIERSEKRSPKWKFKADADLIIQLQPKLVAPPTTDRFDGTAILCDSANLDMLLKPWKAVNRHSWRMRFEIRATGANWIHKPVHYSWKYPAGEKLNKWSDEVNEGCHKLQQKVVAAFDNDWFDGQADQTIRLLAPHCMMCGKTLTDPVSMARRIGPECYGTGSDNLPFVIKLNYAA